MIEIRDIQRSKWGDLFLGTTRVLHASDLEPGDPIISGAWRDLPIGTIIWNPAEARQWRYVKVAHETPGNVHVWVRILKNGLTDGAYGAGKFASAVYSPAHGGRLAWRATTPVLVYRGNGKLYADVIEEARQDWLRGPGGRKS